KNSSVLRMKLEDRHIKKLRVRKTNRPRISSIFHAGSLARKRQQAYGLLTPFHRDHGSRSSVAGIDPRSYVSGAAQSDRARRIAGWRSQHQGVTHGSHGPSHDDGAKAKN